MSQAPAIIPHTWPLGSAQLEEYDVIDNRTQGAAVGATVTVTVADASGAPLASASGVTDGTGAAQVLVPSITAPAEGTPVRVTMSVTAADGTPRVQKWWARLVYDEPPLEAVA
ncbi:hypothetical protein J421_4648 (plasmid) [Gemmatirosa kalamazoonensis]|uniref:Uncharacterized protein n=1 Tax=Gemmatirosa kalamazoonensis TaxID=861299 RepID=W0RRJ5_9BACT|nr:hypothetical protein [Gemmatirosa kalamazoonensis]AHG92115.1 hypothetical protein J421_4580 [Gemmatirosa kalamazoonensis]AHG92183.1 hypothetical protein J421_4648 [Gemmatirosa kalamazoonensis]